MVCFPGYSRRTLAFLGLTFFMQVVVNRWAWHAWRCMFPMLVPSLR
jgi:hypothetical protein